MELTNNFPATPSDHPSLPLFRKWNIRGGIIIDGQRWQKLLDRPFEAIVYSANGELTLNCHRLLCTKYWGPLLPSCEVRFASNVHTKLFIFYYGEVWVGSRNLVYDDSYHNVMVQVEDYEQARSLQLYFERLWSLASPR